ncbi:hypothetical protein RJJ37_26500 [Rhizobium redzepovicii]|uniref:Uncharacterized protein n=1 Tax=Rhizobium redzepovicii TaxID=2867518 RepID=A0AAW8P885_9HYPH|nr:MULTISPECIES: hypothetical protein [Rhizobium]MBB3526617.1 hypothetical protein [Rhizobium sp. BK456]MBY4588580.1 hypothetical protein [Rhizobium redzepovicii]MBY4614778.1 hypothetical protein [Rhizobium redzepovicii]MDF0662677.1 hypothetical protein [Rhizobium sp. BC49]MDR9763133.1 hypothetical protein [Rhizobium redzepovicii]
MTHAPRRKLIGITKRGLAGLVVAPVLAAVFQLPTIHAEDDPFSQFPLVIHCKYNETYHAFYISRVSRDGVATYVASDRIAGTITLGGQAKAIGGAGGGSCVGKTLVELRASHQAYDLKP